MILTIIAFILILGFLVLAHELGHFLVARKLGVAVAEFGLGFPPRLISKVIGGTRWSLNALPLGGFVKIKGEAGESSDEPDSFSSRGPLQRTLIVLAGVTMNIVAAWLILAVLFSTGAPMEITSDIPRAYVRESAISITDVLPDSPAAGAGLRVGDKIVSADGRTFAAIEDLQAYIANHKDANVNLRYERNGALTNTALTPRIIKEFEPDRAVMGVALSEVGLVRFPPARAVIMASRATYGYLQKILSAFSGIITNLWQGTGTAPGLGGPVAIAVATNDVVILGWPYVLLFTAILSLNLAIINILPFPALDGGRIIFFIAEAIRGRPSRQAVEAWLHRAGFALLMLVAVIITYNDLVRFGGRIWQALIR